MYLIHFLIVKYKERFIYRENHLHYKFIGMCSVYSQ